MAVLLQVQNLRSQFNTREGIVRAVDFASAEIRNPLQVRGLIDEAQQRVSGTARLKLYKGNVTVTGRKSPNSLFSEDFATFEKDTVYNQKDAEGFIKINALRLKIRSLMRRAL